ncbi:MAG: ribonuclease III [Planctomycetota bacterium]|nr:MAG: ribonuclease III [Planctomycetota bacterium]
MSTTAGAPDLCTRQQVEQLELELLRPGAALSSVSWARPQTEAPDAFRICFVRDRDRVLHCGAFRRLKHKTQVFVANRDDFYRTRLTHTLEVAQLARYAARALRLNEALVEVLALVHDIGHPPFGHEGERILDEITGVPFDHNRQALHIVDVLESPYPDRRGLNLTQLVRRMILKHGGDAGWGAPPTEGHVLEAQLSDISDSLAYQHHDLEDGLRAGVLHEAELAELSIWSQAMDEAGDVPDGACGRKARLNRMLKASLADLLEHSAAQLASLPVRGLDAEQIAAGGQRLVGFSPARSSQHAELMRFLYERFYRSPQVLSSRAVAQDALGTIVEHYRTQPDALPEAYRQRLDEHGLERTVCDYAAGMTDRFALEEWQRLSPGGGHGSGVDRGRSSRSSGSGGSGSGSGGGSGGRSSSSGSSGTSLGPGAEAEAMAAAVTRLGQRIGHRFADRSLAAMALTHSSARSTSRPPNERLEFLGDAVLGMVVAQRCYEQFPEQPEGELSRIKATTVNRHALADVADAWSLRPMLRVGAGFKQASDVPVSIVADAVEAVLGAVLLDGGFAAAEPLIVATFGPRIERAAEGRRSRNAKSDLQTFTQGRLSLTPNYRLLSETGPDHAKEFRVAAVVGEREVAVAAGRNKRQAEQRAAQQALRTLREEAGETPDVPHAEPDSPSDPPEPGGDTPTSRRRTTKPRRDTPDTGAQSA